VRDADVSLACVTHDEDLHVALARVIDEFATGYELMVLLLAVVVNEKDLVISLALIVHDMDIRCHMFLHCFVWFEDA